MNNDKVNDNLIKDDLYEAVNGEWQKNAVIPDDHSSTGGFMDLVDGIEETLIKDSNSFKNEKQSLSEPLKQYEKFYDMAMNFDKRNELSSKPIQPIINKVTNLKNYDDLNNQLSEWILSGLPTPFSIDVDPDMKNAQKYALFASGPSLFLPDKTYYAKDNEAAKALMPIFTEMMNTLLQKVGFSKDDASKAVENAKKFDAKIAPFVKSAEEGADYSKMYNPISFDDFVNKNKRFDFSKLIKNLVKGTPKQLILPEPIYFDNLDQILSDDNFELMRDWMLIKVVKGFSSTLTDEMRVISGQYSRALSGTKDAISKEKAAYYLASGTFDHVIGDYYGHKYFGEKAKADVKQMVEKMIQVYEHRLTNNTWLSDDTKIMAVKKLNSLGIQVGYPDEISPMQLKYKVDTYEENGSLLSNIIKFNQLEIQNNFDKWDKTVEKDDWEMSANTVNAYYHPFKNIIVFPAAILQKPFYDIKQSAGANFGGIGAVIAHEISHAFDNNGSLFDETGSLNNWWTDSDHEQFKQLADQMIEQFNGIKFANGTVNGKLTVSENIADAGGLSCAQEAAQKDDDNLYDFFTNWARIWRMKSTDEYKNLLLNIDVHAPSYLRAQVQVKNLDSFYQTFDVTESDKMYLAPEKRIAIW
ncbi:M13 family peptidase [Lactobacillus sp. S2-2]|uniref:M13 family metallopeptidase n=1 Tax=Lactobacillus sp. S2-2 TaxID=2692917 RepID=UPI001F1A6A1F|nr:M13-type metalloendopeptidase [Lactobacillus sp. S2-2]MCF6514694.1 M13 family peptidase [Lactobacillus sp. S2-2]